ncbi:putative enoyl-CoA hydratase echA8 [Oceanibacterium hippocampi]|uniref:Putative enoyl-CoA hydratase echA8 n=2 Tax=Oceanibacterium hippocampi TaxID=745714 RepID=A0A1Y5TSC4_9PROT|nr:putative enoyl-CoA hydratase echA8 [Oceanibacterium hippocampi]
MSETETTRQFGHPDDRGVVTCRIESRDGGEVARITLDHPGKMNSVGSAMMTALTEAFAGLGRRPGLRAVVIRGAGNKAFVGGAFLPELFTLDPAQARDFIWRMHLVFKSIRDCPVPVIAGIHGYCLGAGTELAAACDIRIADETTTFGMPEVRVGMPSLIEAALLPLLIGWGKTREMLMTGANYSAREGFDMGFFQTVCEAGGVDAAVERTVSNIFAAGPLAVRAQKRLINTWEELTPDEGIALSVDYMAEAYEGGEPQRMIAPLISRKKS